MALIPNLFLIETSGNCENRRYGNNSKHEVIRRRKSVKQNAGLTSTSIMDARSRIVNVYSSDRQDGWPINSW